MALPARKGSPGSLPSESTSTSGRLPVLPAHEGIRVWGHRLEQTSGEPSSSCMGTWVSGHAALDGPAWEDASGKEPHSPTMVASMRCLRSSCGGRTMRTMSQPRQ